MEREHLGTELRRPAGGTTYFDIVGGTEEEAGRLGESSVISGLPPLEGKYKREVDWLVKGLGWQSIPRSKMGKAIGPIQSLDERFTGYSASHYYNPGLPGVVLGVEFDHGEAVDTTVLKGWGKQAVYKKVW